MRKWLLCVLLLLSSAVNAADFWPSGCSQPITIGQTINGAISASNDCSWHGSDASKKYYTDVYTFSGTAGQKIAISMTGAAGITPVLELYLGNNATNLTADDMSGGTSGTARIPQAGGYLTLPSTGTYYLWAYPLVVNTEGSYTLTLNSDSTVAPTGYWPGTCIQPITIGQTVSGEIIWRTINGNFSTPIDCGWSSSDYKERWYTDVYAFSGTAGQQIAITMNNLDTLDPYLFLYFGNTNDAASKIAFDNNGGGGLNARIPASSGYITLPSTGTYLVWAASNLSSAGGKYSLTISTVSTPPPSCTLSASPASLSAGASTTLTAACSPAATAYTWTGGSCAGNTAATCTTSPAASTTYTVQGSNAGGAGNVASATVTVNAVSSALYTGLWGNSGESGWGMSVTQHGSTIFSAIYTYDAVGEATWYVMSNCPVVTGATCTGELYKVTGGTSPLVPWNGSGKVIGSVGSATLTFQDASHARFDYTIKGVAGSKSIEKQLFSNGTPKFPTDYTDLWWNSGESGWGVALTQDEGMLFAAWFTYDDTGSPTWYVASSCPLNSAPLTGNTCSGDLYRVTGGSPLTTPWVGSGRVVARVGSVVFTFPSASNAQMSYTLNGVSAMRSLVRQAF